MMKLLILLSFTTAAYALSPFAATQQNSELFKYSPDDEYTLPEDIDADKPPTIFQGDVKHAQILSIENKNHGQGKFKYSIQTQNGIELNQVGKLKDENTFVVSGSYSYTGADGKRYRVRYTADEFGYHPITELDVDIPEPDTNDNQNNGFQFLRQGLNDFNGLNNQKGPLGGDDQIGDDYSYRGEDGYDYNPPSQDTYLPPSEKPSNFYLPV